MLHTPTLKQKVDDRHLFRIVPGNQYQIREYIYGRDTAIFATSDSIFRSQPDMYAESKQTDTVGAPGRNEAYLIRRMQKNL
jgi:hypothetical protein